MSTPDENFETAVNDSQSADARRRAIDDLEAANECEKLSTLVRRDDIGTQYREQAMSSLAHPQCKDRLEALVERGEIPSSLEEQAESLLRETPDDAGAGP